MEQGAKGVAGCRCVVLLPGRCAAAGKDATPLEKGVPLSGRTRHRREGAPPLEKGAPPSERARCRREERAGAGRKGSRGWMLGEGLAGAPPPVGERKLGHAGAEMGN